jgi:cation:H+ antiporter
MALTAVVGRGLVFNKNVANRDCIVMVGATLLVFPLMWDLRLVRWEGVLLAILLFGYLFAVVRSANEDRRARNQPIPVPGKSTSTVAGKWWESLGIVVLGVLLLTGGSMLLRDSVSAIAIKLGVSELIIALTMVSVGTSLPELATSIMAVLKKDKGLALGNIVGSNIFNLTLVLGITSIVAPIRISSEVLYKQYPAMLTITLLLVVLSRRRSQIRLKDGYYLAAAYLGIMGWILF